MYNNTKKTNFESGELPGILKEKVGLSIERFQTLQASRVPKLERLGKGPAEIARGKGQMLERWRSPLEGRAEAGNKKFGQRSSGRKLCGVCDPESEAACARKNIPSHAFGLAQDGHGFVVPEREQRAAANRLAKEM